MSVTTATTVIVSLLCFVLVLSAYRSHGHLQAVTQQLFVLSNFEQTSREVLRERRRAQPETLEAALARLEDSRAALDSAVDGAVARAFDAEGEDPATVRRQRQETLDTLVSASRTEWWLTIILAFLLTAGSIALNWQLRRQIAKPLEHVNELLTALAMRRYVLADVDRVGVELRPLFDSFNDLVLRVTRATEEQAARESVLRTELREATRALMQQQHSLLREQRLAANGELAAQVAHDLRNPLAGILMAVTNLRDESEDAGNRERLDMVADEVRRLSRQLDSLLKSTRQQPESARELDLRGSVDSLLALTTYQIPTGIELRNNVPEALAMRLPESGFRHALLNLILNACNAIDDDAGHVSIGATIDAEHVVLSVRDSGPGFSEEALALSMRAFATFSSGGTGLGLSAVRRYVGDLGGSLEIGNHACGAEVGLRLPKELQVG